MKVVLLIYERINRHQQNYIQKPNNKFLTLNKLNNQKTIHIFNKLDTSQQASEVDPSKMHPLQSIHEIIYSKCMLYVR